MSDWYPLAARYPHASDGGEMVGGPPRGVLHTTETSVWAGAPYYHIEYKPGSGFRQYRPFTRAARGLRHPTATPQTNRQGTVCIQLAVTDYAKNAGSWSDETYADLAEFIAWCNAEFGIQARSRFDVGHGGEAYGEDGTARMLWDEWELHNGWCGHQEVTANTHWDAGKVNWLRLLEENMPQFTDNEVAILQRVASRCAVDKTQPGGVFHDDWQWALDNNVVTTSSIPTDVMTKQEYAAHTRRYHDKFAPDDTETGSGIQSGSTVTIGADDFSFTGTIEQEQT